MKEPSENHDFLHEWLELAASSRKFHLFKGVIVQSGTQNRTVVPASYKVLFLLEMTMVLDGWGTAMVMHHPLERPTYKLRPEYKVQRRRSPHDLRCARGLPCTNFICNKEKHEML